jgi:hypothetical protein
VDLLRWPGWKIGRRSERGNLAVITGVIAIPLAMIIAMTMEMVSLTNERARMQAAVDAAALAGARELAVSGGDARNANGFAETFALNQVTDLSPRVAMEFKANQNVDGGFEVSGVGVRGSFFGNLVPPGGFTIRVSAVGEALNQQPLCVLALTSLKSPGLTAAGNSSIQASNCLVHSNGHLATTKDAQIKAGLIQATGSVTGSGFSPSPNSGALAVADPFLERTIKRKGACDGKPAAELEVTGGANFILGAGVHNRPIRVDGHGTLTLQRGEHYFCRELINKNNGRLLGDDVVLIFDDKSSFQALQTATLSLTGRTSGDWAGFLIVGARDNVADLIISSPKVDKLLGTIYLPSARLVINAPGAVAEASQWSVVVAKDVSLTENASLVINTDYAGSGVPVPIGVGDKAGNSKSGTRLRR